MTAPVLLLGLGAQAKYAAEIFALLKRQIAGIVALEEVPKATEFAGLNVLGGFAVFGAVHRELERPDLLICCADAKRKEQVVDELTGYVTRFTSAIHPRAVVATTATVEPGTIVNAHSTIQPYARIDGHSMIHAGTIIEHDCRVGPFANIAPGAVLCGHVHVGRGATVFANATVIPTVKIGDEAVVAAGAVVTQDVAPGTTVIGAPATPKEQEMPRD